MGMGHFTRIGPPDPRSPHTLGRLPFPRAPHAPSDGWRSRALPARPRQATVSTRSRAVSGRAFPTRPQWATVSPRPSPRPRWAGVPTRSPRPWRTSVPVSEQAGRDGSTVRPAPRPPRHRAPLLRRTTVTSPAGGAHPPPRSRRAAPHPRDTTGDGLARHRGGCPRPPRRAYGTRMPDGPATAAPAHRASRGDQALRIRAASCRPRISMACSRISTLRIFPVTVMGKESTTCTYRGIL